MGFLDFLNGRGVAQDLIFAHCAKIYGLEAATSALAAADAKFSGRIKVPPQDSAKSWAAKYREVLLGLVERAIAMASARRSSVALVLFQKRAGRAIYSISAELLKYYTLFGVVVANRIMASMTWVPICADGPYSSVGRQAHVENLGVQSQVAGELDTQGPLCPNINLGMQSLVAAEPQTDAEEHCTNPPLQSVVAEELDTSCRGKSDWSFHDFESDDSLWFKGGHRPIWYDPLFEDGDYTAIPDPPSSGEMWLLMETCLALQWCEWEEENPQIQSEVAAELDTAFSSSLIEEEEDLAEELCTNHNLQSCVAVELDTSGMEVPPIHPLQQSVIDDLTAIFDGEMEASISFSNTYAQQYVEYVWPGYHPWFVNKDDFCFEFDSFATRCKPNSENYFLNYSSDPDFLWPITTKEHQAMMDLLSMDSMEIGLHGNWPCYHEVDHIDVNIAGPPVYNNFVGVQKNKYVAGVCRHNKYSKCLFCPVYCKNVCHSLFLVPLENFQVPLNWCYDCIFQILKEQGQQEKRARNERGWQLLQEARKSRLEREQRERAALIEEARQKQRLKYGVFAFAATAIIETCTQEPIYERYATAHSGLESNVHTVHEDPIVQVQNQPTPAFSVGSGRTIGATDDAGINVAPYQQEARLRWLNSRKKNVESQQDRISRYADMHGISYEQARSAFSGATEAVPSQAPLLPSKSRAYKKRSVFGGGPSTRAQRTIDVVLNSPAGDEGTASSIFYFNPVNSQELKEMSEKGNTMLSLDALEIAVDPVGMPGDDTDITVVAMWNQDSDPQRALLGSMSTFVGNGLARCVFFPGLKLMHQHCSVPDGRVLKIIVSSTNSTLLSNLPRAQISIGTLRQHLGPGHDRTINQDLVESQIRGYRIGATQQGSAVILAPRGTAVEGTPSANVDLGIGRQLVQSGPLSWKLSRSQSAKFSVQGTSRPRGQQPSVLGTLSANVQIEADGVQINNLVAPRYADAHSGLEESDTVCTVVEEDPFVVALTKGFSVAKDAKRGTYIGKIDFLSEIRSANKLPYQQWVATGLIDPVVQIKVYAGSNPFVGTTISGALDIFRKIDVDKLGGKMPVKLAGKLPNFVHPLSGVGVKTYTFDTSRMAGHSFYPHSKGFADPIFHFFVFDDNDVPCAANWKLTVDILLRSGKRDAIFECIPFLTLPYTPPKFLPLDINLGVVSIALSDTAPASAVRLAFADLVDIGTKKSMGMTQAIYGLNCGVNGRVKGRITKIGTSLVSCIVRLVMWWGSNLPNFENTSSLPHEDINLDIGAQDFDLQFQSPFAASGCNESAMRLGIYAVGGPLAPTGCNAPCNLSLHIYGVETASPAVPISLIGEQIAWLQLSDLALAENSSIYLPNHICEIKMEKATVQLRDNPLSRIFGSCGFFSGEIEFIFSWSCKSKIADEKMDLWFGKCFGKKDKVQILNSKVYNLYNPGEHRHIMSVGDFSGFNKPGGTNEMCQFNRIWCRKWENVGNIDVSIKLLPGFKFYGWSCISPT
uniref:Polyprotein n=1 Tax=Silene diclinis nepovirus TaxID=3115777 RepID=A0AAT9JHA2_9SECO